MLPLSGWPEAKTIAARLQLTCFDGSMLKGRTMGPGMVALRCAAVLRVCMDGTLLRGLLMVCLLALTTAAGAQTRVGGVIATDTRWTAAASPYLLQSDLIIQNKATLVIEAGVEIDVAPGVAAHVQEGTLKAVGRRDAPIRVQSLKARDGGTAAPGDYKAWAFNTDARNVELSHVQFRHGSGLIVRGNTVKLDHVELRDGAGPAISVDLAASLIGGGNVARGNGLDAVLVPAGDITGTVTWGLRGIPYVVESGQVSVGQTPTLDSLTPATLQAGETTTVQVVGKRLAGLVSARSSLPGVSVDLLPGATATSASLQVTAAVDADLGAAALSLLTDAGIANGPATLRILAPQATTTALEPARVFVGQGVVALDVVGRGFGAQTTVLLGSTAQTTTWVDSTRLRVSIPNQTALANLAVRLRSPDPVNAGQFLLSNEVALPVQAAQIRITPAPAEVIRGARTTFTVALPYAPPGGDATVTLVSSVPGVASVPASVVVPAGESAATFELSAVANGNTVITASRSGMVSGQSTVTVVPPPSLRLSPPELLLGAGRSAELELVASKAAPVEGLVVTLLSSAPGVASVPERVTIAGGATSVKVPLNSHALGAAVITASADSHVDGVASISVRPVSLNLPSTTVVAPGLTRSIPLTLSDPAPEGGLTVQLRSADASIATVPASLQINAGATTASFTLSGVTAGRVRIDATASGYEAAQLDASIESIAITLGATPVTTISVANKGVVVHPVRLARPAPAGGVVIDLAVEDPAIADVQPRQVSIAEGELQANVTVAVTATQQGSSRVIATSPGLAAAQIPLTVQAQANLTFSRTTLVMGRGTRNYTSDIYLGRRIGTSSYSAQQPAVVRLQSSDPSRVRVPETVTIPAGTWLIYFQMEALELTDGASVVITASEDSYTSPATPVSVTVNAPELRLMSFDARRTPLSARDDARIQLYVTGAPTPTYQQAARDLVVDLAIVNADPATIVGGFHSGLTAGNEISTITIPLGAETSPTFYIGAPTATGTYAVRASSTGVASTTSAVVTVSSPELEFSRSTVIVGKGATTYTSEVTVRRVVDGVAFNGAEPLQVTFTSNDGRTLGQTVTIPANQATASLRLSGLALTEGVPSIVDAHADGYASPRTKLAASVITPELRLNSLDLRRSPGSIRDNISVQLYVAGASYPTYQTATSNMPVDLAIVDATVDGIVEGFHSAATAGTSISRVTIAAGSEVSPQVFVGSPTAAGTYRINASNPDIASTTSAVVTVTAPELRFSRATGVVGKGLDVYSSEIYVQRVVEGVAVSAIDPVSVTFTSSDPTRAVIAPVTIPANQNNAYIRLSGVDFTNGIPAELTASAPGHASSSVPLKATVIAPEFRFTSLDVGRSPASARDDFRIQPYVAGASYPSSQTATVAMPIDLSIVEASPAGIVSSFHSAVTGGTTVQSVTLAAGAATSPVVYIETPRASGSYRVRASRTGVAENTSALVTVSTPGLRFSRAQVIVGQGLRTYDSELSVTRVVDGTTFNGVEPLVVSLRCSAASLCSVPETVTIPANASSVVVRVTGLSPGATTISATAVGYDAAVDIPVTVILPRVTIGNMSNVTMKAGTSRNMSFSLSVPGASYSGSQVAVAPLTIALTSSAPGVGTVPASVTIRAEATSVSSIPFVAVAPGTTTVTVSGADIEGTTTAPITVTP